SMCGWVEIVCILPFQVSYFMEVRLEHSKLSLLSRLSLFDGCLNGCLLQLLQQIWWNLLVEIQFSLDDTDYSLLCIVEGLLPLSLLDETCQVKGHFLSQQLDFGLSLASCSGASLWHVDLQVPS